MASEWVRFTKETVPAFINAWKVPRAFDDRIVTSWLMNPLLLALFRLLFSLYAFATIVFMFAWNGAHHYGESNRRSFSNFTDLSWWGLAFYFLISGIHTLLFACTDKTWLHRWPRVWSSAHNIFYLTVVTFPFLVTIMYWAVLYPRHWFPSMFYAWSNISRHGLNSLFALFEIVVPRTNVPRFAHVFYLILILMLYLALAEVTHVDQGFYPYPILDPSQGYERVAAYAFGVLAATCAIFGAVCYIILWRKRLTEPEWREKRRAKKEQRGRDLEMSRGPPVVVITGH